MRTPRGSQNGKALPKLQTATQMELSDVPECSGTIPQNPGWPSIDGFEIREQLGCDGQGEVYRAFDTSLQAEVALKIPRRTSTAAYQQLRDEARALAQVRHPHVVSVYSCEHRNGHQYFTMQLVPGFDASKLIQRLRDAHPATRDKPLDLAAWAGFTAERLAPEVARVLGSDQPYYRLVALWMAQAADGLAAALDAGILHRDLKPSNVLVGVDGRLVVVDFGLARSLIVPLEPTAGLSGTYPYVAPERIAGDGMPIDHRADIWALGATLYELLTLRRAYDRKGSRVLQDIGTRDPVPIGRIAPDTPPELVRICQKAMRRDPEQRYQDWRTFASDLRAMAHAAPAPRFGWGWAGTAVAVSAAVFAGVSLWNQTGDEPRPTVALDPPPMLLSDAAPTLPVGDAGRPIEMPSVVVSVPVPEIEPLPLVPVLDLCAAPRNERVLLIGLEDRNTEDQEPLHSAAWVPAERKLAGYLRRKNFDVISSTDAPVRWTDALIRERAIDADASLVVLVTFLATPGEAETVGYTDSPIYPWTLTFRAQVIRACDGAQRVARTSARDNKPARQRAELAQEWQVSASGQTGRMQHTLTHQEAGLYEFSRGKDEEMIADVVAEIAEHLKYLKDG